MQLQSVELVAKPVSAGSAAVPAANLHSGKPLPQAARLEQALPQQRRRPAPFRASPACLPLGGFLILPALRVECSFAAL